MLEQVPVTRYVTPLCEGGSLPAVAEAGNLGTVGRTWRDELTRLPGTLVRARGVTATGAGLNG